MKKRYRIRFAFPDGDAVTSLAEIEYQLLMQNAAMAISDDPSLRTNGRAYLHDVAALVAASRVLRAENTRSGQLSGKLRQRRAAERYRADLETCVEAARDLLERNLDPTAEAIAAKTELKLRRVNELTVYRIRTLAES